MTLRVLPLFCLALLSIPTLAAAQKPVAYRDFTLGSSVAAVVAVTRIEPRDVVVLHRSPSLLQEITWLPRYTPGASSTGEVVREMRFRFIDDRLFSLVVAYDAHQIEGLTRQDLVEALSSIYGRPAPPGEGAVSRWAFEGAHLTLSESSYPSPYTLQLVDTGLNQRARAALAEASREAVARTAERRAGAEAEQRLNDAEIRERNKAGFRP